MSSSNLASFDPQPRRDSLSQWDAIAEALSSVISTATTKPSSDQSATFSPPPPLKTARVMALPRSLKRPVITLFDDRLMPDDVPSQREHWENTIDCICEHLEDPVLQRRFNDGVKQTRLRPSVPSLVTTWPRPDLPVGLIVPPRSVASSALDDTRLIRPTHILAVRKSATSPLTIYSPIHWQIILAHCAKPPAFIQHDDVPSGAVPVVRLDLPSPDTWCILKTYIYTPDARALMRHLLEGVPVDTVPDPCDPKATVAYAAKWLAHSPELPVLMKGAINVYGTFLNAVALRIRDEVVWKAVSMAWMAYVAALQVTARREGFKLSWREIDFRAFG